MPTDYELTAWKKQRPDKSPRRNKDQQSPLERGLASLWSCLQAVQFAPGFPAFVNPCGGGLWRCSCSYVPVSNPNKMHWFTKLEFVVSVLRSVIDAFSDLCRHVCWISQEKVLLHNWCSIVISSVITLFKLCMFAHRLYILHVILDKLIWFLMDFQTSFVFFSPAPSISSVLTHCFSHFSLQYRGEQRIAVYGEL